MKRKPPTNEADASMSEQGSFIFGHPKGLFILFFTEMWERFSYFGMRALLVLYLTQSFLLTDQKAFAVFGSYMAMVFLFPIIGGIIADRYLGFNRAVIFGGILILIGHLMLAYSDIVRTEMGVGVIDALAGSPLLSQVFYTSLSLLIIGVGFLKPCITTMVSGLYEDNSVLREAGFTIFWWGIMVGGASAPLICGYLGQRYGWGYGFGLAGIGMGFGLATFLLGQKHCKGLGEPPDRELLTRRTRIGLSREWIIYIGSILSIILVTQLMRQQVLVGYLVIITVVSSIIGTLVYAFRSLDKISRERLFAALILTSIWVAFVALIEQSGSSVSLFTERSVDRFVEFGTASQQAGLGSIEGRASSSGFEIQTAQFQSLIAGFAMILAPFFAWLWVYLARRKINPSTPIKMSLSMPIMGVGFALLAIGTKLAGADGLVDMHWLIWFYFSLALADVFIGPIGLSMMSSAAPKNMGGFMMGFWWLAVSIGEFFAVMLASRFAAVDRADLHSVDAGALLVNYGSFFTYIAMGTVVLTFIYFSLTPLIKKWMHGLH